VDQIRVVFLGTGAGSPSRERNVASCAVVLDGRVLLFDCGEGTQHQLLRSSIRTGRIEAIFITHLHGDHLYGLPGLLATLSLNGRTEPLTVCGPAGLDEYLTAVFTASRFRPPYRLQIVAPEIYQGVGYRVITAPLEHTMPSFGFCVIEDDRAGEFDVARARDLAVPAGPLFGRLQRGEDIVLDGRVIHSAEVVGAARPGRRVAYCTDTRPCAAAIELARGADVLIHEATYGSDLATEARERGHSTAEEAARVAEEAGARLLLLTHFSARYEDTRVLLDEARRVFPQTDSASDFSEWSVADANRNSTSLRENPLPDGRLRST
jgi:ribonuclease Z